ncbi:hypothetical protein JXA85_07405 [Candidatus Woesearchaeota archaeon]|nr:hypothetical protein [Candidatus Woesearchaeota archaeon]
MGRKSRTVVIIIMFLLLASILLSTYFNKDQDLTICRNPYTIKCYDYESSPEKVLKEQITCSTNEDCLNLTAICAPGMPAFADCIGFNKFCGEDNTCKCCCPDAGS